MNDADPCRILYMEDEVGLARLMQKKLGRLGYEVDIAPDGETGLAMVTEKEYSVLLIDYNMPGLCGTEVISALVARGPFPPAIMVTGNGNEAVAVEAMKLGATDYLVKDVDMHYLELLPLIIEQVREKQRLIREKEAMLRTIRENEERYRRLVELTPDGIAVILDERIAFMNPSGVKLLGHADVGELSGKELSGCIDPDSRESVREQLKLIVQGREKIPWIEVRMLMASGSPVEVEVSGIPFTYQDRWAILFIFRDITERKLAQTRLHYLAHYDALTELPNRTLFFDRLRQTLLYTSRYGGIFALLFIDLDGFKQINDTLGHDKGDLLLREAADRIRKAIRQCDTVARMGGDEFTAVLSRITEPDNGRLVAEKIISQLGEPFDLGGVSASVGASIGVCVYPEDGEDEETLLKNADIAMYKAKRSGRGKAVFFSDPE